MTIKQVQDPKTGLKALLAKAKELDPTFKFRGHKKAAVVEIILGLMGESEDAPAETTPTPPAPVEVDGPVDDIILDEEEEEDGEPETTTVIVEDIVMDGEEEEEEEEEDDETPPVELDGPVVEDIALKDAVEPTPIEAFKAEVVVALTAVALENPDENPATFRSAIELDEVFERYEATIPVKDLGLAYLDAFNTLYPQEKPKAKKAKKATKSTGEKGKRGRKAAAAPELTPEMTAVVNNTEISQSEKFRQLHDLGLLVKHIEKATDAKHYSFVYSVVSKYKIAKELALNAPATPVETVAPAAAEEE